MNLEDEVCSLELATELEKLGVKQESQHHWCEWSWSSNGERHWSLVEDIPALSPVHREISAFTVAELGEILPVANDLGWLEMHKGGLYWYVSYKGAYDVVAKHVERDKTEANSRARMLIWLVENKVMVL